MRRLPVELQAELVQYLDPRELAIVSTTAKGFHQLVTRPLYRHIVFHARSAKDHLRLERLFITIIAHVDDIAPFVQHLDLDWDAGFSAQHWPRQEATDGVTRVCTRVTVNGNSPTSEEFDLPLCRSQVQHEEDFRSSDRTHTARVPLCRRRRPRQRVPKSPSVSCAVVAVHALERGSRFLFLSRSPSTGTRVFALIERHARVGHDGALPQGREAKLTRLDLRVVNWWDRPDFLELLQLLRECFFTVSCINVFGPWAKDFLTHTSTVTVGHVTRAGVPCFELRNTEYQLPEILVGVARLFPNVRTLDILDSETRFADRPFLYRDIARLVQGTDGLQRVDRIGFPDGKAYSRMDSDDFELLATRVEDYPHILWPGH